MKKEGLLTTKDRVLFIYNNYKDAVNFDAMLCIIYENYFKFPNKLTHNEIATIKRCGRYWRSNGFFRRSCKVAKADKNFEQQILEVFVE